MGFSDVASQTIMFIAVITISVSLIFMFNTYVGQSSQAVRVKQDYLSMQLKTSMIIEAVSYDGQNITAYVRNLGDTQLKINHSTFYVNRERIARNANLTVEIESDTDTKNVGILDPNEVMKIHINKSLTSDEKQEFMIVTLYNTRDVYEFST